ncbi:unnamed protein product, partial [marine sediment metagenome]
MDRRYKVLVFLLLAVLCVAIVYAELTFRFLETYPAEGTVTETTYKFTLWDPRLMLVDPANGIIQFEPVEKYQSVTTGNYDLKWKDTYGPSGIVWLSFEVYDVTGDQEAVKVDCITGEIITDGSATNWVPWPTEGKDITDAIGNHVPMRWIWDTAAGLDVGDHAYTITIIAS